MNIYISLGFLVPVNAPFPQLLSIFFSLKMGKKLRNNRGSSKFSLEDFHSSLVEVGSPPNISTQSNGRNLDNIEYIQRQLEFEIGDDDFEIEENYCGSLEAKVGSYGAASKSVMSVTS